MKVYPIIPDSEEQGAVVSARTSRSPHTFDVIHEEVRAKGHKAFLQTNVLGYGHSSVAEVAQCPIIAIEDISDLAGNVIATSDPQLVVQMTSTRYQSLSERSAYQIDDSRQRVVSPIGEAMKAKYCAGMPLIQSLLEATNHPRKRTLQCDIARAYLPAGISTQLSIRGNARTMRDAVTYMLGSGLPEVQEAGRQIQASTREHVEVLFDRHIDPLPEILAQTETSKNPGYAEFLQVDSYCSASIIRELELWRDSGYHRRFRMANGVGNGFTGCGGNFIAEVWTDWGAYRDLRRNRTILQQDMLPNPQSLPTDPLWAFRELYPDICDKVEGLSAQGWNFQHEDTVETDPYLAPMGSMVTWRASGHIFNWAYLLRLRSGPMCHPAYAIPCRHLMNEILDLTTLADALGLVESKNSLLGVEFKDRVPG